MAAKKEVKVEKKFCTNCGKELGEKETCDCATTTSKSVDTEALKSMGKEFLDTNVKMYKKPETTLEEEVSKNSFKKTLIILGVIAVSYGLYLMGFFKALVGMIFELVMFFAQLSGEAVGAYSAIDFTKVIDLPYFKIFIYGTLIYYAISFLPVLASLAVAKLNKKNDFSFHKSTSLYVTSMIPTVIANVILAVIFMLNVSFLTTIGLIGVALINLTCLVNYIIGFLKEAEIKKDKKAYSVVGLIAIWLVLSYIVARLIITPLLTDIFKDFKVSGLSYDGSVLNTKNKSDFDFDDLFNW